MRIHVFAAISIVIMSLLAACSMETSSAGSTILPDLPETVENPAITGEQTLVVAGGCFWGVEAVFEHVKGVRDVKSGYAGGDARSANYDLVSEGRTDHAESVKITYDPAKTSLKQLLEVFFTVAHDPTQLDRQGPDVGRQYRSAIFYASEEQRSAAASFIEDLERSRKYQRPIVTELVPLKKFYDAEAYHQDYMRKNPDQPYIVQHDKPKIEDLKTKFPDLFVDKKYVKFGE